MSAKDPETQAKEALIAALLELYRAAPTNNSSVLTQDEAQRLHACATAIHQLATVLPSWRHYTAMEGMKSNATFLMNILSNNANTFTPLTTQRVSLAIRSIRDLDHLTPR